MLIFIPAISKSRTRTSTKASHPDDCCYITYHYQSCMFSLLKFYKKLVNKIIFDVAINTINIIFIYHTTSSQTWCYQAFSHHMVYKYHLTN